jgi:hypothetical protein
MFGLLSLARDRAAEPAYRSHRLLSPALSGGFCLSVHCADHFTHKRSRPGPAPCGHRFIMSTVIQAQNSKKSHQHAKAPLQAKSAPKPQSSGLSREEIRQIVLEMIG